MAYKLMVCELINHFGGDTGVEIGIRAGETSELILTKTKCKHLYMIDPWEWNFDVNQGLYNTKRNPDHDCKFVIDKFNKLYPDRSTIIRKKAEDATNYVPNKLDFIFIDGNHHYDYVMKDLNLWVPKVRSGGLIIGHDWSRRFPGVIEAVIEFSKTDQFVNVNELDKLNHFVPAPNKSAVIMKSWPRGNLWWSIKK